MDRQSSRVVIWIPLCVHCNFAPLLVIICPAITLSSSAGLSQATNRWLGAHWHHNSSMITAGGPDNSTNDSVPESRSGHMALMLKITQRDARPGLMDYWCPCGHHFCALFCACWQEWKGKSNGWGIPDPTGRVWIYGDRQEALKREDRWTHLKEKPAYIIGCCTRRCPQWVTDLSGKAFFLLEVSYQSCICVCEVMLRLQWFVMYCMIL